MISVIVPIFKVELFLRQCLDSIIQQTYKDLEIILIDDGSPDHCGEICNEYEQKDDRIRVFHTDNRGLSAARNLGLKEAKGEYIGFVDSDDWIEPDMYEVLFHEIERTDADISLCEIMVESDSSPRIIHCPERSFTGEEALQALLDSQITSVVWNKLYRKEIFASLCFPEGNNYEDVASMHLFLAAAKKVSAISSPKYHYRRSLSDSITKTITAKNLVDYADAHLSRFFFYQSEYIELFGKNKEAVSELAAKAITRLWRSWYQCDPTEKRRYQEELKEMELFSRRNFPFFGYRSWPIYIRVSTPFTYSTKTMALLYFLKQSFYKFRDRCREKTNE